MNYLLEKIWFLAQIAWVPFAALVLSALLVRYSIGWLCRHGFAAEMGTRHIHKKVTPTAGGIGMILAFVTICWLCNLLGWIILPMLPNLNLLILSPLALLCMVGLYDDRYGMRPVVKLLGQIAASALAWFCGLRFGAFFGIELPPLLAFVLTVFWFLLFINAFNLIDGLDGLAAGLAVVSGVNLAAVLLITQHNSYALLALILVGVCLGFLRYNFHPARIFMGDTGSMFLGYMLAALGLASSDKGASFFAMMVPMMVCGVPLIDTMLAVWRRATFKILSKRSWQEIMSADRSHLHHRMLDAHYGNQTKTAIRIYALAVLLSATGIIASSISETLPMLAILLILFTLALVLRKFAIVEMWNSTQLVVKGLAIPRRGILINILHPVYDLAIILAATVLSILLYEPQTENPYFLHRVVASAFIVMLVLALTRTYKVYWLRAGTPDFVRLSYSITAATVLLLAFYAVANLILKVNWHYMVLLPIYMMMLVGILGERIQLRWAQMMLPRYFSESRLHNKKRPVLLYGAGALLSSYQNYMAINFAKQEERVVGIIDNDLALIGQYMYGYKILGDPSQLDELYQKYNFYQIVVLTPCPMRKSYEIIKEFCSRNDVELLFFTMQENSEPQGLREE